MNAEKKSPAERQITRRAVITGALSGAAIGVSALLLRNYYQNKGEKEEIAETFIAKASSYDVDIVSLIEAGMRELGVTPDEISGKRILLKPNLVETMAGSVHICTHPEIVRAAAETFLRLGAKKVIVGEGPGHCRETLRAVEETGLAEALLEDNIAFVDTNNDDLVTKANTSGFTDLKTLTFPAVLEQVDWVVSMPKMKTHHWAGVTLSMKNLFGLMPGILYGWPKNVFHFAGIQQSIIDINAAVRPNFAIVDGIVGMEGDGPIMGTPKQAGVIVMGRNLGAVDATCARIMKIDPLKVRYLKASSGWLGTIRKKNISQRGETIASVQTRFHLVDKIPAHMGLRLKTT